MAKRKGGLLALIAGLAVGATALFLSKKENRAKVVKTAKRAASVAKKEGKKVAVTAKKVVAKGKAAAKKVSKKVAKKK
ncbi:MAG: hypothetical protein COU63_00040 [Candidatus Pacebacteria bacterium CG10_big_fil_rev_8_21_14_0_10_36_11]|nr:MAG: hypothetical protein AUK08_02790 [Candidatus Pacebacteria bacterium CG2_30_36_39]PIR65056.1 MAG: hypothetical protein COU63_00040 [Candidatus Pacebacteria bacterium CG10_big_fil_rev_8_21_14_0_10_36_11]PJC42722.1 MAG: hypothetical protein CO040_02960 [Candidatus Pacebacteria bacterium CG_4_9_14_0_2_um_filter_36_8]